MRRPIALVSVALLAGAMLAGASSTALAADNADPPANPAALATSAADHRMAGNEPTLLKSADDRLVRTKVQPGTGGLYYIGYERTHRGLPVFGGDAVVVTDSAGNVLHTSVAQSSVIDVDTAAKVTAAKALARSQAQLDQVDAASTPRLVVLAWGTPRLAWETVVTGARESVPSKLHVFVDARTGRVTDSYDEVKAGTGDGFYNGNVTISTSGSGSSFSMSDPTRPGRQLGQRLRHQPGDRVRRRALRRAEAMGHAGRLAGPRRNQRQRWRLPREGGAEPGQRLLERQLHQLRPFLGQPAPGHADRRGGARVRPRDLPNHTGWIRWRGERAQRGHRRHLRRADRSVRQQRERPAGLPRRRRGRSGRQRPDPQHVQPRRPG